MSKVFFAGIAISFARFSVLNTKSPSHHLLQFTNTIVSVIAIPSSCHSGLICTRFVHKKMVCTIKNNKYGSPPPLGGGWEGSATGAWQKSHITKNHCEKVRNFREVNGKCLGSPCAVWEPFGSG